MRSSGLLPDDSEVPTTAQLTHRNCPQDGLVVFYQWDRDCSMSDEARSAITGSSRALLLGRITAWAVASLYVGYIAVLFAGGVTRGVPREPYLAIAEVLTIVGALLQVALCGSIYECASPTDKRSSLIALGWMLVMAGLTITVHFVQLTVGRQIDVVGMPVLARILGWEWPSFLYAIELAAWHLFFGLSLLFAASTFRGRGREALVRSGLRIIGLLCVVGLVGPAVGNLNWRMVGAFAYGVLFPITCVLIALVFRDAPVSNSN